MMNSKMTNKKYLGFTIVETLTALVVITTISVLTVCATVNSDETKFKKLRAVTKSFYSDVYYAYQTILSREVGGGNIQYLNSDEYNIKNDSAQLAKLFGKYMDAYPDDCKMFPSIVKSNYAKEIPNMTCAHSPRGVSIGFYLNRNCNLTLSNTLEFMGETKAQTAKTRILNNCCGYIMYAPKKSQGVRGLDFFLIGLGKRRIL